jgi:SAM-dependent methyltransferase|tara:strand:- start:1645 stop:2292 length:648 start_codon:yes stop_codon:yes gene_type:complete
MNTYDYVINKYNIDVGPRYIVDIPNMGRDDMADLFAELGFNIGAEIGVFKGKYSEVLCKANPKLKLYGVDAWRLDAHEPGVFVGGERQSLFDGFLMETLERMAPYQNYKIVQKLSMDAVKDFEDESLDFVYIDAGHDFTSVTNDLHFWLKKVKPGGIMSGHDYARYPFHKYIHVKRVLEAYCWSYKLLPLFIVGSHEVKEGEIRDRYRSWFFVKK